MLEKLQALSLTADVSCYAPTTQSVTSMQEYIIRDIEAYPGVARQTPIFRVAYSSAAERVNPIITSFAALFVAMPVKPTKLFADDIFTIPTVSMKRDPDCAN